MTANSFNHFTRHLTNQAGQKDSWPEPQRLLAVFAHPDDEVFAAGGALARAAANGAETMIVSATRGEAGQIRDASIATRRTLGQVREQELHRSGEQLGARHTLAFDYGDGTLQNADPAQLVGDITRIIRLFRPDTVITFGPDGAYGHPDHVAISTAATQAVQLAGHASQFPEQLSDSVAPHTPDRLYYSYFPRTERLLSERLGRWLVELYHRFEGTVDFAHALLLFSEEATMLGYISDTIEVSWVPAGASIIEQGEPATKLYLILSGQAEVLREDAGGGLRSLAHIGPGHFFGEEGLVYHQPRNANVVAVEDLTCLVFSPTAPTNYAGRGAGAQLTDAAAGHPAPAPVLPKGTASVDVTEYVPQKVAALASHQTQFPFEPDMLPMPILSEIFGREYFRRVPISERVKLPSFSLSALLPVRRETATYAVS